MAMAAMPAEAPGLASMFLPNADGQYGFVIGTESRGDLSLQNQAEDRHAPQGQTGRFNAESGRRRHSYQHDAVKLRANGRLECKRSPKPRILRFLNNLSQPHGGELVAQVRGHRMLPGGGPSSLFARWTYADGMVEHDDMVGRPAQAARQARHRRQHHRGLRH